MVHTRPTNLKHGHEAKTRSSRGVHHAHTPLADHVIHASLHNLTTIHHQPSTMVPLTAQLHHPAHRMAEHLPMAQRNPPLRQPRHLRIVRHHHNRMPRRV